MSHSLAYYQNLNELYKKKSGLGVSQFSSVYASLKPISRFKSMDEIELPYVISGRLVSTGTFKDGRYGEINLIREALKPTTDKWVGIKLYSSHAVYDRIMKGKDVSINEVLGKITRTEWNDKDEGIDFYAEIYDKQIAYKMAHGLIEFISVGFGRNIVKKDGEYYFMAIEPKEASLVYDPRDKKAKFKPVKV